MHPNSAVAQWVSPKRVCIFELITLPMPSTPPLIGKVKKCAVYSDVVQLWFL